MNQFCETILNLDKLFRKKSLNDNFTYSSGGPYVQWSGAIMIGGIMRNMSMK